MKKKIFIFGMLPVCMIGACISGLLNMPEENRYSELVSENVEAFTKSAELTEDVIECGRTEGKCWMKGSNLKFCKEYSYYECEFKGDPILSCNNPC